MSWAHPEFGSIIASASFDRTVKLWEQVSTPESEHQAIVNGSGQSYSSGSSRWVECAVLSDAKGTVRSVEFAPHHFGLKLVSCFSDSPCNFLYFSILRQYQLLLSTYSLCESHGNPRYMTGEIQANECAPTVIPVQCGCC